MSIFDIPDDRLLQIFESLSFQDTIQCALVCKRFNGIVVSNFSKFYHDIWKADSAPPFPFIQLHTNTDSIVTYYPKLFDLFEFHPFTRHLYWTAIGREIPRLICYDRAAIPHSSLLAYLAYPEDGVDPRRLFVYDLTTSRELDSIALETSYVSQLVCSRNTIVVSGCCHDGLRTNVYSWDGAQLKKRGAIETSETKQRPVLSATGILAYHSKDDDKKIEFIDFSSVEADDAAESHGNGAESSENGAEPSGKGAESPGKAAESSENGAKSPGKGAESSENSIPAAESIEIDRFADMASISRDGQQLVTMLQFGPKYQLAVYSTQTRSATFKFEMSLPDEANWFDLHFSDDGRFLLTTCHVVNVIDLHLKRMLSLKPEKFLRALIRSFCGNYYLYIFTSDDVYKVQEVDLTSDSWQYLE